MEEYKGGDPWVDELSGALQGCVCYYGELVNEGYSFLGGEAVIVCCNDTGLGDVWCFSLYPLQSPLKTVVSLDRPLFSNLLRGEGCLYGSCSGSHFTSVRCRYMGRNIHVTFYYQPRVDEGPEEVVPTRWERLVE